MNVEGASAGLSFALPRLRRDEAQARTLLAQRVRRCECRLGDTSWELSIEPLSPAAAMECAATDWVVRADWAGAPFELRLPAMAADHWLHARFAELDLPSLPPPIRSAAFEAALQDVIDVLGAAGFGPARIHGMEEAAPSPSPSLDHHFGLALCGHAITLRLTLSTDRLGLTLMSSLAAHAPIDLSGGYDVPVLLRAEIGRAALSGAELQSLQPRDAIVMQECWVDPQGELRLGHGDWGLRVRAEGSRLVVTEPFHSMEPDMDEEEDDADDLLDGLDGLDGLDDPDDFADLEDPDGADEPEADAPQEPQALDALPVRLRFDLGERSMPLAEARALQVGQVVELSRPLSQAVNIRANGVLIGTGDLIEIGGRLAVAITTLGRRHGVPR